MFHKRAYSSNFFACLIVGLISCLQVVNAQIVSPASRIVYQRSSAGNAIVPITGNCPANTTTIEAKATPINGGKAVDWTTVGSSSNGGFNGQLTLLAGWYQLEIRATGAIGQTGYWTVDRVGVGEVIIVSGQSNAQGTNDGPDAVDDRVSCISTVSGAVRDYELPFRFRHLDGNDLVGPTNNRHFYGALGDMLVSRLNVPVLILGAAIGGTSSEEWAGSANGSLNVPDDQWWDGQEELRPYRALGATINHYARRLGLRGILWFHGESDKGRSGDEYVRNIQTVINKSRSDIGVPIPWVIAETSWIDGGGDETIRNAQRRLVSSVANCFLGPNTDRYGNEYRRDGTHFAASQMILLASLWNNALTGNFFSGPPAISTTITITAGLPAPARQYAGGHIYVSYMATGASSGAAYTAQLLDASGSFVATLGSGTTNPLLVNLPDSISGNYRILVSSTAIGSRSTPSEKFEVYQNGLGKGTGTGLAGAYFPNQDLAGTPAIERTEGPLDFTWISSLGSGMPADNRNWSARWTGQIEAPRTGIYRFKSMSDDGNRIWVNNQLLINDWNVHPWAVAKYGQIYLEAGKRYAIKVELRQDWYAAQVKLLWMLPGQNQSQFVPKDRLYALPVSDQPLPPVVSAPLPSLIMPIGQPLTYTAGVFSDPANRTLDYSYEGLPDGLQGSASSLRIAGTPTTAGGGSFTVRATNSAGLSATATGNWLVTPRSPDPTNPAGNLALATPRYDCNTGAIMFLTTGGNGSAIEFMAPGITAWTTNPNQYLDRDARTANDTPPFTLRARQSGVETTLIWSRQAACEDTKPVTPTPPVLSGQLVTLTGTVRRAVTYISAIFSDPTGLALTYTYTGLPDGLQGLVNSAIITGTPTTAGDGTFTIRATNSAGLSVSATGNWTIAITPVEPTNPTGNLILSVPIYTCSTGAITFLTTGGNGSAIEFMAPGITAWTTNPNQYLDRDARTADDTPPFTLRARQSGVETTLIWSRQAACDEPTPTGPVVQGQLATLPGTVGSSVAYSTAIFSDPARLALTYSYSGLPAGLTGSTSVASISGIPITAGTGTFTVKATNSAGLFISANGTWSIATAPEKPVEPTNPTGALVATVVNYNCSTGQITLGSTGGTGSTVEFMAVGITGWSSAQTFTLDHCSATCFDTPPFVINIRQYGQAGQSYTWSRQNYCASRGRLGAAILEETPISLYPNPALDLVTVELPSGFTNPQFYLLNVRGKRTPIYARQESGTNWKFSVAEQPPGLYILTIYQAGQRSQTRKLLKQ